MKRAAILTQNFAVCNFIFPELELFGYEVKTYTNASTSFEDFDFVIVDVDTVASGIADICVPSVALSQRYDTEIDGTGSMLSWPCRLSDISRLCELFSNKTHKDAYQTKRDADTVSIIDENTVLVSNRYVKLSHHEMALLRALCEAKGEVVSREQIMALLRADDGNISDVYICHLRRKLDEPLGRKLIITERGRGYRTSLRLSN